MLIYFREIKDHGISREKWKNNIMQDIQEEKSPFFREYMMKAIAAPEFDDDSLWYCIEKGDDAYGVFSYAIARFCTINRSNGREELIIFPSKDPEWDENAKQEAYKVLSEKILSRSDDAEWIVCTKPDNIAEIERLKKIGFRDSETRPDTCPTGCVCLCYKVRKKFLVTGVTGELGFEVARELAERGYDVLGCDTPDTSLIDDLVKKYAYVCLDIADSGRVNEVLENFRPEAVINCYSWSQVDEAELPENRSAVDDANIHGVINLAKACHDLHIKLMLMSSDYVFNGKGKEAWKADCKDYAPLNYYGVTKMKAEQEVGKILSRFFVVRTEWTFGIKSRNFVDLLLDFAQKRPNITVVDDQVGIPTYFEDLSKLVADMIVTDKYGFYNVTNSGEYVSRNEYAKEIFRQAYQLGHIEYGEERITVDEVSSEEYKVSKAIRPLNSRLDLSKLADNGFMPLPDWKDALNRYLKRKFGMVN